MLKLKNLAAGAIVVSAGLGVVSASPALADTGRASRTPMGQQTTTRQTATPDAPSRTALRSASYRSGSYSSSQSTSTADRYTYSSRPAASTYSTVRSTTGASSTAYRRSTSATGTSSTSTYRTVRSTSTTSGSSSTSSTSGTSATTSTAATTTVATTATVSATGSCTLGAAANGTTCNQAISYMLAQKTSGSTSWHNRCLGLVSQAYGGAYSGYGTAAQAASAVQSAGLMHTTSNLSSIPRGAVVWFANSSGSGHVVISLGNGQAISSDVPNGSIGAQSGGVGVVPISYFTQTWGQTLIGWSAPQV